MDRSALPIDVAGVAPVDEAAQPDTVPEVRLDAETFAILADIAEAAADFGPLLPRLAGEICQRLKLRAVAIGTVQDGRVHYRGVAPLARSPEASVALAQSICRQAVEDAVTIAVPTGAFPEHRLLGLGKADVQAVVAPIVVGGVVEGVLVGFIEGEVHTALAESLARIAVFLGIKARNSRMLGSERRHLDRVIRLQNLTTRILAEGNDIPTDAGDLLRDIAEAFEFDEVRIGLQHGDEIWIFDEYAAAVAGTSPSSREPASESTAGRALLSGKPQVVWTAEGSDAGGEISIPLHLNQTHAGVICARAAPGRRFVIDDLGIMLMLAESIGLALNHRRRLAQLERRNRQLALVDSVVTLIAEKAIIRTAFLEVAQDMVDKFGFSLAEIGLLEDDRLVFTSAFASGDSSQLDDEQIRVPSWEGVCGRVLRTGRPEFIHDVRQDPDYVDAGWGSTSEICIPIFNEDQVVGVLNVESTEERPLDDSDFEALQIIARHLGIALENEKLLASERENRRAIEAIQRVSLIVTSAIELDDALLRIVEMLSSTFNYPYVIVGMVEGDVVVPRAAVGCPLDQLVPIPLGTPPSGLVALRGETLFVQNLAQYPEIMVSFDGVTSLLSIPIISSGDVLGVLSIMGTDDRPVHERDAELLTTFARGAGIVLNNARVYDETRRMALNDSITGLPNHRFFQVRYAEEFARVQAEGGTLSIMLVDLDNFKQVNDRFGHLEGDAVLGAIGRRLSGALRAGDLLARYAGDEFVLMLPDAGTPVARQVAARLVDAMQSAPFSTGGGEQVSLTISIGIASYPADAASHLDLIRAADHAMYVAKQISGNAIATADSLDSGPS